MFRYSARQARLLALIVLITVALSVATALQPWPLKLLVDYGLGGEALPDGLRAIFEALVVEPTPVLLIVVAALASFAIVSLNSAFDYALARVWATAGQRMVYDLAGELFHRLQRLSLSFHQRRHVGDLLSRLTGDAYCVYTVTEGVLVAPAQHLFALVAIGALAWSLDAQLTALLFAVAPILGASAYFFGRRLKQRQRGQREAQSRLMAFVQQTLSAVPLVQAFAAERRNMAHFRRLADTAVARNQSNVLVKHTFTFVNGVTTTVGIAIVLFFGGQRVLAGTLSVGSLLVFMAYLRSVESAAQGLLRTYGDLRSTEANIDRVLEVLDAEEGVAERPGARALPEVESGRGSEVCMEGVSFGYVPGRVVLSDIDVCAGPGETVALVGATGAGKSTLVSLIARFFDPWSGRVLIDGHDVRDVTVASLRERVGLVLQEAFLLPLSVAENIAYGRTQASREDVVAAAVAANADGFIRALPEGYETVLGERGVTLSGGERQRIAIARALLKDAPVLILDEPTSALDAGTEAEVMEALGRLMRGRTTFVIAHRMSTIRRADRIVVLEGGRVVERGTHEELMAAGGVYRHLYTLQLSSSNAGVQR